ncbi:Polysaccharide deacetylase [Corynebacterium faecale]|nr:Polysaccharide deacetylase [Corynebacterium faecale]
MPTTAAPEPENTLPPLDQRESVIAAGLAQRGEIIGTGGKPAIALRFDHHLDDFRVKVLPILEKYRLPWGQMINSGHLIESEATSFHELARMTHDYGGEVWNHGWSHTSVYSAEEADREITQGLVDLRAGLPSLWVDGWAQPGQSDYMGLDRTPFAPEHYYETYPGRLVLSQHAFVRGYYPGVFHELKGQNLIGQAHVTIDKQVDGRINSYVRRAVSDGTGVTLMLHPNYLDLPGYLTTEELDKSLGYIASLRDQDQLEVLSNTGILMAEDDLPEDYGDLLTDASGGELRGEWESEVSRALNHLGVPHEAEVWVSGTGTAILTVEVESGSYPVVRTHSVELKDEPQRMSVVLTAPLDTTSVTVRLTGNGLHDGISYQPL